MKSGSRLPTFLTAILLAAASGCKSPAVTAPDRSDGGSDLASPGASNHYLRYPTNVLPPVAGTLAMSGFHSIPQLFVLPSGRTVLLDDRWRILLWNPSAGLDPLLLPSAISRLVAGPGDVLFQRNVQGSVQRLALATGSLDAPFSDQCGEAGPVSRITGGPDKRVVGVIPRAPGGGGAVVEFGEGPGAACSVVFRTRGQGWTVQDAQATREALVVTETNSAGSTRAVFHDDKGSQERFVPVDFMNVDVAADAAVFWSAESGRVFVVSTRDAASTPQPAQLFDRLPANQPCVDIEAEAGRFILFRNSCGGQDGGFGAGQRALFEAPGRRVVAMFDGLGPMGVSSAGNVIEATPEGVHVVGKK